MHHCCAKRDPLFPAPGQTAGHEMAAPCQPREGQHPALLLGPVLERNAVDACEEIEILFDGEIIVERELLRHVSDALSNTAGAERADFTGKRTLARGGFDQTAEHLYSCRFAGA